MTTPPSRESHRGPFGQKSSFAPYLEIAAALLILAAMLYGLYAVW